MNIQEIDWSGNVQAYGRKITVPSHTMQALKSYIEDGTPPGDFLYAVMSNNLIEAFSHADDKNFWSMQAIAVWIYNNAPAACRGEANIKSWIRMHNEIRRMKAAKERNGLKQGGKEDGSVTV